MTVFNYMLGMPLLCFTIAATLSACVSTPLVKSGNPQVNILAFNDFHGHLEPPKRFIEAIPPTHSSKTVKVPVGGVSYLADALDQLRAENPNHVVVSAGDLTGASPLLSALFLDEPTIEVMNEIGIDFNVLGNHEFDRGIQELLRLKQGGCQQYSQMQPCQVNPDFPGAKFDFLSANVRLKNQPDRGLFPGYIVKSYAGIPVAFIGITFKTAASSVAAAGIRDITFLDEADTVNAWVGQLKQQGVEAIVLVIHDGALAQNRSLSDQNCEGLSGPLLKTLDRLDPEVDIVISAHTHQTYQCDYATHNPDKPFLLTSAGQYGIQITKIQLELDHKSRDVVKKAAQQVLVQSEAYSAGNQHIARTAAYPQFHPSGKIEAILKPYRQAVTQISSKVVGHAPQTISRSPVASGESPLGLLIADIQQAAALTNDPQGSDFALMNPGGIRADLRVNEQHEIRFGDIFAVQPFGNSLVTLTLTGQQIRTLLEQQWSGANAQIPKILQPSKEFSYQYSAAKTTAARAHDIKIAGTALIDQKTYRVTVNSFLADGGDNFSVLKQGAQRVGAGQDIDAMQAYLAQHSPLVTPTTGRIQMVTP